MHTGPGFANGSVVWVVVGSVAAVRSAHQLVAKLAVGRPVPVLVLGVHVEVFPVSLSTRCLCLEMPFE